ncbi:MAG TPA: adenosylcobinamide-GDP ribazoletransferase [Rhodoblastus sp.]|nr:adenosylcobinamide-GDP ribazoletransferase [Rhodoblastus sp.]
MAFSDDFLSCLGFWSRLPVAHRAAPPEFRNLRALPVAALTIALPAVAVLALGRACGLSPLTAALAALAALAATTGAFHEDGLADSADALGGATPERRLDIMKDSRIGTFGTLALIFSVALRAGALAALIQVSTPLACLAIFASAAVSRVAGLTPLATLPAARESGLGFAAGRPDSDALRIAIVGAILCAALPLLAGASAGATVLAALGAAAAAFAVASRARALLGGHTGDVAGAAQQLAEIAYLVIISTVAAA